MRAEGTKAIGFNKSGFEPNNRLENKDPARVSSEEESVIRVSFMVLSLLTAAVAFGQQKDAKCVNIQSSECRDEAAKAVQRGINQSVPDMQVLAFGDVIVFVEPKMFNKLDARVLYRSKIPNEAEIQLCSLGFKKIRFDSSVAPPTPNEEYDLRCGGNDESSKPLPAGVTSFLVRMAGNQPSQRLIDPSYSNGRFDAGNSTKL